MAAEDELRRLGIELPSPPKPVATYIPAVRVGELVFLCGVIPVRDGMLAFSGKLGRDLLVSQGYAAARVALLNALAILRAEVGSLDRVKKVVRMVGYVASGEGFGEQPAVINGASDLLVEVFAEAGRHARVAVGVAELPLNAPVELELIVQVD
ncbi:MAG: RidA family protein [Nitrospirales bacterium]